MMMEVKYCMSISDEFFQYIIPLGIFFRNIWSEEYCVEDKAELQKSKVIKYNKNIEKKMT